MASGTDPSAPAAAAALAPSAGYPVPTFPDNAAKRRKVGGEAAPPPPPPGVAPNAPLRSPPAKPEQPPAQERRDAAGRVTTFLPGDTEGIAQRLVTDGIVKVDVSEMLTEIYGRFTPGCKNWDDACYSLRAFIMSDPYFLPGTPIESRSYPSAFGGTPTPSLQHAQQMRAVHEAVDRVMRPVASSLVRKIHLPADADGRPLPAFFSVLHDRGAIRRPGQKMTRESWHRDVFPKEHMESKIRGFGGWVNFNHQGGSAQYFSHVPGSHWLVNGPPGHAGLGFDRIPKDQAEGLRQRAQRVEVLPGEILIFSSELVHEVAPLKNKSIDIRLFSGCAISFGSSEAIHPKGSDGLVKACRDGDLVPLKSGQIPEFWPKLYWVNHFHKLLATNSLVIPEILEDRTRNGEPVRVVPRHFPSLSSIGMRDWLPPYTDAELARVLPSPIQ